MAEQAAIKSIFDTAAFRPFQVRWQARLMELSRRRSYYDGSVYTKLRSQLGWLWPRLYQGVKPLYLPLARAVDVDAGIIPGDWVLPDEADPAHVIGVEKVFDWSDWSRDGVLYIHYGAQFGLVGLRVADLREAKVVQVKPVKPTNFMLVGSGDYDNRPAMAIYLETRRGHDGAEFEYAEVVTAESIRTYKNGVEMGYDNREPEYPNELKFVPYVEVQHIRTGDPLGENTYQKATPMLDEVNQLASYLADIIGRHAEPQWAVSGAEASDMVKAGDNIWFLPTGASATPLLAQVDFAGVLSFIQEIRDQVHGALPELAFDELRKKDQIATATLELQLMELVLKVKRCRPNYDHGLADALRMAGLAGQSMGLREVAGLADERLAFDARRPVLPLDPLTAISLRMQEIALEQMEALAGAGEAGPVNENEGESDESEPVMEEGADA